MEKGIRIRENERKKEFSHSLQGHFLYIERSTSFKYETSKEKNCNNFIKWNFFLAKHVIYYPNFYLSCANHQLYRLLIIAKICIGLPLLSNQQNNNDCLNIRYE